MSEEKGFDFAAMAAALEAEDAPETTDSAAETDTETKLHVRRFKDSGLKRVSALLEKVRTENDLHADDFNELITDPEYSDEIDEPYAIDPTRVFPTKLDLCKYFTEEVFPDTFLELTSTRTDAGLWTWLAVAYYTQFVKVKKNLVKVASNARWIYDPDNYRFSVRHYLAGPVYLYRTFKDTGKEAKEILFASAPQEFGGFIDSFTYKVEATRLPVLLEVAAWLYYDSNSVTRIKKKAVDSSIDKPGTVRQYLRVAIQYAETRDFYGVEDAHQLWSILPKQFDVFKNGSVH